ncbi:hypothetical protein FR943_12140 [Mycobacterium sp. TNTM28]|uniref:Uncharacterized protein n=1 Tax=[Mycobacterium] fortunisiensis TaxID=2600579 RepID=A0ABS6KLX7_9MYCO|nr:MmpS family transport accessory protein [[Mycobacterium] fortunisiensis]MBU9764594.1 hypothetical protein [[Mycobacterium] fortunisiensis]
MSRQSGVSTELKTEFETLGRPPIGTTRATYEITGAQGASGHVSYLDDNAAAHEARFSGLPWSVRVTTTDPGILVGLVVAVVRSPAG